ncbi:MAG: hypothetical protein GY820_19570 [Gammaproteobacteria bacterium]|nr:hypothetical protein [Gammaproteobacteria bacterium]
MRVSVRAYICHGGAGRGATLKDRRPPCCVFVRACVCLIGAGFRATLKDRRPPCCVIVRACVCASLECVYLCVRMYVTVGLDWVLCVRACVCLSDWGWIPRSAEG